MKNLILVLTLAGMMISCNTDSKTEQSTSGENDVNTSSEQVDTNFTTIDSDEALIATALLAAPEESRADCTVIGYNMAGEFVTLKEGTNEFIVLADDPKKEGFSAACYHKELEPFMARGRELKAEGKTASARATRSAGQNKIELPISSAHVSEEKTFSL